MASITGLPLSPMTISTMPDGANSQTSSGADVRPIGRFRPVMTSLSQRVLRSATALHVLILALLAYVPTLTAAPGRMPTDTKLYLYLDPGRLTADALYSWDSRQFAGWVPHQTVSYLWPSGPWYSVFSWLGVPDWVAHRLWIGTLMLIAGLGVRWAAKVLGLTSAGALIAALFYQLSPYILPYVSRTSTMLLPWAGLGWLIGLTVRAATRSKWRDVGIFGLVMATVSATNATAILMIAPGPVLWLVHAVWERSLRWRQALVVTAKLGGISVVMSAWWISMLTVQGRYGADVLGYSETLEAVSLTSNSTEVMRGLGYWLFYVRDPVGFTTSASYDYLSSGRLITFGFLIFGLGLLGMIATRWSSRRFAALLVVVGTVLAIGVHPIADPSPLMSGFAGNSRSSLALAMRSSTRALPLSTLGVALGIGALASALAVTRSRTRLRVRRLVPVALAVLAIGNLPVLFNDGFVDQIISRDEHPPASWEQAADALDELPEGYRVLQLPGIEFGAYRWGYTVDPPLPGMTRRPLVTRDLLPLGSSGAMDLLYSYDDRFQDGTAEVAAIAPIARLLGADTVWLANDVAFDRFRTPRPEATAEMFRAAAEDGLGLGASTTFGNPTPNVPTIAMVDEDTIANSSIGEPLPAVELVPIEDPQSIVRVKVDEVVVAGSGDGIVDAASAGLITGAELLRYAADLLGDPDSGAIADADRVIITDSNRDRAHHWHGSQDVWGFTEDGSPGQGVLKLDTSDQRIPVFPDATSDDQTIAIQTGRTTAAASNYGEPFAYRPENRAAMAVDGDLSTAWVVSDRYEPVGEFLRLTTTSAVSTITLTQPQDRRNRWITRIDLTDSSGTRSVELTKESRTAGGQTVALRSPSSVITVRIAEAEHDPDAPLYALDAVGFAEATTELGPSEEVVRVPSNVLPAVAADQDLDLLFTRLRTRSTNRWRADPEPTMVRSFTLDRARAFAPTVTTRLNLRANDSVLAALMGWSGTTADRTLTGVPAMGGWAATDGDPATNWVTPFGAAEGSTLDIPFGEGAGLEPGGMAITLRQPTAGPFNVITDVLLRGDTGEVAVQVPPPDANGESIIAAVGLDGRRLRLTITGTGTTTIPDRRYSEQVELPAAISEVTAAGIVAAELPATIQTGCRDDLATIDGEPITVDVSGDIDDLFDGEMATVESCSGAVLDVGAGTHVVRSTAGLVTGVDVDRIVLSSPGATATGVGADDAAQVPSAVVVDDGRISKKVRVAPCPDGCWFVFGEGYNLGWTAQIDGQALPEQQQVDGGFNGWYLPPSAESRTISLTWEGQSRLTIGLVLTAMGVVLCLALILLDRRRRVPLALTAPELPALSWPVPDRDTFTLRGPGVATTLSALVLGTLVISPVWGLTCGAVAAVCAFGLRRARLVGAVALAMLAGIAAIMVRRFLDLKPFVNAGWPGYFEDLHRPGLAVIVLLGASVIARPHAELKEDQRFEPGVAAGDNPADPMSTATVTSPIDPPTGE